MVTRRLTQWSVVLVLVLSNSRANAGEKVLVGMRSVPAQRVSMDRINHAVWDSLLRRYVDAQGRVAYRQWKASGEDMQALDGYLRELSRAESKVRSSRSGRLAYWINAYNAVTVRGILREYPTKSIRDHTSKFGGYNIWKDLLLIVGDSRVSLNDIEHQILRKVGEPRIHFAIVCASSSCPRLRNRAYTGAALSQQLDDNARHFFSLPTNFRYANGRFYLSSILKWFADDFGDGQASRLQAIAPYLSEPTVRSAAKRGAGKISYLPYDWRLNEQSR